MSLSFESVPASLAVFRSVPLFDPATAFSPLFIAVPYLLMLILFFVTLKREPGPLVAGAYLTGMGHAGLQVVALIWLKPYLTDPSSVILPVFAVLAALGTWRAIRRKNEDDSLAMIAYFLSTIAAIAFGYFVISHLTDFKVTARAIAPVAVFLASLPAYFSARACATQVALIGPGGQRATSNLLGYNLFGAICGAIVVSSVHFFAGAVYATVAVACIYLLAAWLFTQSRSAPFTGIAIPTA